MLQDSHVFSGFSVDDLAAAETFYGQTLGLDAQADAMGLQLHLPGNTEVFIYEKADHQPATFTILNFVVADIDAAVAALKDNGVTFEHYDDLPAPQDEKNILRGRAAGMGPDIAWFKDPAGNILAVLQS